MKRPASIFISHAWGGTSDEILAQLVKRLESEDITFILDKRDLAYRQSIRDFMVRLGEADMVIIILSNKYLKSEYCMFELLEIHKNENLNERIFPIVLDEVKISSSADRLEFVKYWETQLLDLQNKVKELNSLSYIEGITDDLNLYAEIRNNIARLTGILRDINTLNIKLHQESDYHDLVEGIKRRINGTQEERTAPSNKIKTNSSSITSFPLKQTIIILFALFGVFMAWGILSKSKSLANNDETSPDHSQLPDTSIENSSLASGAQKDSLISTHVINPNKPVQNEPTSATKKEPATVLTKKTQKPVTLPESGLVVTPAGEKESSAASNPPAGNTTPAREEPLVQQRPRQSAMLYRGKEIYAKCNTTFSSDDPVSLPRHIIFTLEQPVMDGRTQVIPAGAPISAKVVSVKKSDQKRSGIMDLVFEYLETLDGQKISLHTNEFHWVAKGDVPMDIRAQQVFKLTISSTTQITY